MHNLLGYTGTNKRTRVSFLTNRGKLVRFRDQTMVTEPNKYVAKQKLFLQENHLVETVQYR